jgi:hypothetical protein
MYGDVCRGLIANGSFVSSNTLFVSLICDRFNRADNQVGCRYLPESDSASDAMRCSMRSRVWRRALFGRHTSECQTKTHKKNIEYFNVDKAT